VNSLLLSRCHVLMRTASFLSAWSSIFNPALPVVMLNRPIDGKLWFPDREILGDAVSLCLPAAPVRRVAIAGPRFEAGDST
jgi:hypothetical protein